MFYKKYVKRGLDVMISFFGMLILSPVLLLLMLLTAITHKGKIFFRQERIGKDNQIFRILKFKTMNNRTNEQGLLSDAGRTTPFGRFMRKTSLDELPNLWNVLLGNMSLIGPRPLLTDYLPLYNKEQARRHEVRGGISGWAQINGRNTITWKEKFEMDVWYVDNLSFRLDMNIFFLSIKHIFMPKGVNASEEITMEKFTGNN